MDRPQLAATTGTGTGSTLDGSAWAVIVVGRGCNECSECKSIMIYIPVATASSASDPGLWLSPWQPTANFAESTGSTLAPKPPRKPARATPNLSASECASSAARWDQAGDQLEAIRVQYSLGDQMTREVDVSQPMSGLQTLNESGL